MNNSNNKLVHILVTLCYCGGTIMIYHHKTLHIGIEQLAKKCFHIHIVFFWLGLALAWLTQSLTMPRLDQSKPFSLFSKLHLTKSEQNNFETISFGNRNESNESSE